MENQPLISSPHPPGLRGYFSRDLSFVKYGSGSVLGLAAQQITLPLFISTLGGSSGVYYILLICSSLFNVVFWPLAFVQWKRGKIDPSSFRGVRWMDFVLIGLFDALNGLLIVYSSVLNRTSGPLQAILGNSLIPFTLLFSVLILGKRYHRFQLLAGVFTLIGLQ